MPAAVRASFPWPLLQWFRTRPLAVQVLLSIGLLVALLGSFYAEENWRGERAWNRCQRELAAKGVELDWLKFIPPAVPDEQNFAMTAFLRPLFDFNQRPLRPGQNLWRDTVGHERCVNFGAALWPADKLGQITPAKFEGQMTDLELELGQLRQQSNSSAESISRFASRAAAAAAVLEALEEYHPVLEELRAASRRPDCRFNIQYNARDPMTILLPHYLVLQRISKVLLVRGSAELALKQSQLAFDELRLMFFLEGSIDAEPFLVSIRARANMLAMAEQLLWEGLGQHRWSEPQLRELQSQLMQINLISSLSRGLRAERAAFGNQLLRYLRTNKNAMRRAVGSDPAAAPLAYLLAGPEGWFYQEQVVFQSLFEKRVMALLDPRSQRMYPHAVEESRRLLGGELAGSAFWHHNALSKLLLSNLLDLFERVALAQTRVKLATAACALERYCQSGGDLPDTLDRLVPEFVSDPLLDVCDAHGLKYRLLPGGRFLLYGVGWNESDDGGAIATNSDSKQGDWVWPPYVSN